MSPLRFEFNRSDHGPPSAKPATLGFESLSAIDADPAIVSNQEWKLLVTAWYVQGRTP